MTKTCRKCGVEKPLSEYYRQSCGSKPYKHHCKTCEKLRVAHYNHAHREERKKFYWRNPTPYKDRARARYGTRKETILQQLAGVRKRNRDYINARKVGPCADCKKQFPHYVMDFDHVRGEKEFNLSKAAANWVSIERIQAELDKCDLVCANCHRIRSYTRGQHRRKLVSVAT